MTREREVAYVVPLDFILELLVPQPLPARLVGLFFCRSVLRFPLLAEHLVAKPLLSFGRCFRPEVDAGRAVTAGCALSGLARGEAARLEFRRIHGCKRKRLGLSQCLGEELSNSAGSGKKRTTQEIHLLWRHEHPLFSLRLLVLGLLLLFAALALFPLSEKAHPRVVVDRLSYRRWQRPDLPVAVILAIVCCSIRWPTWARSSSWKRGTEGWQTRAGNRRRRTSQMRRKLRAGHDRRRLSCVRGPFPVLLQVWRESGTKVVFVVLIIISRRGSRARFCVCIRFPALREMWR